MGVYIKGMEMPHNCFLCKLSFINGERLFCTAMKNEEVLRRKIDSNCPLVEVPTSHGRLIDADALKEKMLEYFGDSTRLCQEIRALFCTAPTIIESEE